MKDFVQKYILYIAWIESLLATLGSLFFSEVMKLPPCVLCWYQRIAMYPLVAILAVGILRKDKKVYQYVLPLSITGWVIALYHNLLYYNILPESVAPCTQGISCTVRLIEWFGFVTIPLMSFFAFSVITVCMFLLKRYNKTSK
ncbi:MAG: disulfide bond formation protein B [Candidatus Levybacteria bacterium]|nr:disulfide bond formation protein B [Candidatus Levybacteria bacterium]